ncbi:MAG TPA: glycosyltransferase family 4 protein [Gemmatimonadales bacterium]|nr:glycosyltransferase family 4 protein [Gemmatimonadales bacterium]
MPAPRILFVNHGAVLGGGELSLLDIVRHTASRARVALLSPGPLQARLEREGVPTLLLATSPAVLNTRRESSSLSWSAVSGTAGVAIRLARAVAPDELLYANSQKAFVVAALAARLRRRPLLWHLRDVLSPEHFSRRNIRLVVNLANRCTARVIANSEATAEVFVAAGGRADKVVVVPSGVDPTPFRAAGQEDPRELRRALGIPDSSRLVVGLFSRVAPWKGQHVAIEAMARLPGATLLVVGAPLFGEVAYAEELTGLVARMGLGDRVKLLGFREDIPSLMRAVDVVVHTSLAPEPFGRVLVEAMLMERPVIATDAGGAREIVQDGVTGLLIPPGRPDHLAEALGRLLEDSAMRGEMGRRGRERAERHFTLVPTLNALDDLITSVASGR